MMLPTRRWLTGLLAMCLLTIALVRPSVANPTGGGSVTVTIAPAAAITAGAQWSIDGGTTWRNSGASVSNVSAGSYTLTFHTATGYLKPGNQSITVSNSVTTAATGIYLNSTGTPLWGMGANIKGQLGLGNNTVSITAPTPIVPGVTTMAIGANNLMVVKADGSLWATGDNSFGELGDGSTTSRNTLEQIVASDVIAVACSPANKDTLFVKSDGSLWGMGANTYGELGLGDTAERDAPTKVVASGVVAVAVGYEDSYFVKTDGSLWGMGHGSHSELGSGGQSTSPVQLVASGVVSVAAGFNSVIFLKTDGTLWGLGWNLRGQFNTGNTTATATPVQIASNVAAAAMGAQLVAYVTTSGALYGLGDNSQGELNTGNTTDSHTPVLIVASGVAGVACGNTSIYWRLTDGSLWGIGNNGNGQLGEDTGGAAQTTPYESVNNGVAYIAAGSSSTTFLGTTPTYTLAASAGTGGSISPSGTSTVSLGATPTFTITPATGYAIADVLVDGTSVGSVDSYTFAPVQADHTITASFVGVGHAVLVNACLNGHITANGTAGPTTIYVADQDPVAFVLVPDPGYKVKTFVFNGIDVGALAGFDWNHTTNDLEVSALFELATYTISASGDAHTVLDPPGDWYVTVNDTQLYTISATMGYHLADVVVDGSSVGVITAYTFSGSTTDRSLSVITERDAPGHLQLWGSGRNTYGELGTGDLISTNLAVRALPTEVVAMAAGTNFSLYLLADGSLWGMGYNGSGQLGTGDNNDRATPVQIRSSGVTAIAAHGDHSLFITSDNKRLWAMGWNGNGQLGTGDQIDRNTPMLMADNVVAIAAGSSGFSMFVQQDGSLWAVGRNDYGQLGTGDTVNHLTPVKIIESGVAAVDAGNNFTVFTKTDGSLWGMGYNGGGKPLGLPSPINYLWPTQSVASDVIAFACSDIHTVFLKADHTLWGTGSNAQGGLGTGGTDDPTEPVQIASDVTAVAAGALTTLYTMADGSLWTTGANSVGELSVGTDEAMRTHFTKVVASGVTAFAGGGYHMLYVGTAPLLPPHFIFAYSNSDGTVTPVGTTTVSDGGTQVYVITPNSGATLDDVQVDFVSVGTVTAYTFSTVTGNHTISASFSSPTHVVNLIRNVGGRIVPNGGVDGGLSSQITVATGDPLSLEFIPDPGYQVLGVTLNEYDLGAPSNYTQFSVGINETVTATFDRVIYTVDASASAGGIISPPGPAPYVSGSTPTFTITPDPGYEVDDVLDLSDLGSFTDYGDATSITLGPLLDGHQIFASFRPTGYTIHAAPSFYVRTVAAGTDATKETVSNNGLNWAPVAANVPSAKGLDFDPTLDLFVGVGAAGGIMSSPDGLTWTALTTGFTDNWLAVVHGAGPVWVAVSATGTVTTSTDGATWTTPVAVTPHGEALRAVTYSGLLSLYVAAGDAGVIATSADGSTWTVAESATTGTTATLRGAASGQDFIGTPMLVVVGDTDTILTSNDGVSWTLQLTDRITPVTLYAATFSLWGGGFIVGGAPSVGHDQLLYSNDGQHWIPASAQTDETVLALGIDTISYSGLPVFTAVGTHGLLLTSKYGSIFTVKNSGVTTDLTAIASGTLHDPAPVGGRVASPGDYTGPYTWNPLDTPMYTITPYTGYTVTDVLVDGSSVGSVTEYTFDPLVADHHITATFAPASHYIVATAGANGSISPAGTSTVNDGDQPFYAITPDSGYRVTEVLVDGTSVGAVTGYTFVPVTGDHSISATFGIAGLTITAVAGGGGSVSPGGTSAVDYLGTPVYEITPNSGYHTVDVLVDGSSVGAVSTYTFDPVTTDHSIAATFAINTYTIVATAGTGGSIAPAGTSTVNDGATPDYVVTPSTGYHIADVQVDGSSVGTGHTYQFPAVHADHTIAATFALNVFAIEATASTGGSISPAGTSTTTFGGTVHYTITPTTGYHVADVEVDGTSVGAVTGYTFTGVATDHTIDVFFAINQYTITASSGDHGTVSPTGTTTVNYGDTQGYAITPSTGYHIAGVLVDGSAAGTVGSYTFSNVTRNHTISATFVINQYTIAASSGANGTVTPPGSSTVSYGDTPFYAITPATNYHVATVLVDGSSVGAVTGYTFAAITTGHTLSATFAADVITVVIRASTFGTVTNAGTTTVAYGATVTSVPTAATTPASHFVNWTTQDGTVVTMPYTVTGSVTLTANFLTNFNAIRASSGANGTISPTGTTTVASGATQTYTMTPASGYRIGSITVDGTVQTPPTGGYRLLTNSTYTFGTVIVPHTIAVAYVPAYAIILEAAGGGTVTGSLNGEVQTLPYTWSVAPGTNVSLAVNTPGGWTFYGFFNSPGTAGTTPALLATGATATTLATFVANASAEYVASFDTTGANPTKPYATVIVRPKNKIASGDLRFFFGLPGPPMINDPSLVFAKANASNNAATFAIQQFVNGTGLTAVAYPWSSISGGEALMAASPVGVAYLVRVVCTTTAAPFQRTVAGNGNFVSATTTLASYNSGSPTQTTTTLNNVLPGASGINNPSHYHYTAIYDVSVSLSTTVWDETFAGNPAYVLIPGHVYQWKSNKGTAALTTSGSPIDIPTF